MRTLCALGRWSMGAALSLGLLNSACAARPTAQEECANQRPSPPPDLHLAALSDSALAAARVGALIVRVVPNGSGAWYRGGADLIGSLRRPHVGASDQIRLRETNTPGVLAADGLQAGEYELTVGSIGYLKSTNRVTVRSGFADTLSVALNERLLCLSYPIIVTRGIFDGPPRYP
jgi:hypothetical protein